MKKNKEVIIRLENAYKSWQIGNNNVDILKNINLNIYSGESLAIMGPSGAGKSTLLHILGLLTFLDKGNIWLGEQKLSKKDSKNKNVRRNFGFIFQDAKLINDMNVMDNLCVPLIHRGVPMSLQKNLALKCLNKVGLINRAYQHPNQLSGGEIMRIALARALILEPRVLLADEPTGSLDSVTGEIITKLLMATVNEKRALVIVTHHKPLALKADHILYMKDGIISRKSNEKQ